MIFLIAILKVLLLIVFVDALLYWSHRAYHAKKSPRWIKKYHAVRHRALKKTGKLKIHWVEIALVVVPTLIASCYLAHPIIGALILGGVYLRVKAQHACTKCKFHHERDERKNLGVMFPVWDKVCNTKR